MRFTTPSILRPASLLAAGLFAGCTGSVALRMPISGAETVSVNFSGGNPVHAENDDIKVEKALLVLDSKKKEGSYAFAFRQKNRNDRPTLVKVEDVTDDAPVTWVEDRRPELKNDVWSWQGDPMAITEGTTKWIFELENSIRIYRFTILTARGHTWVLYEAASYPDFVKTYLRHQLGLEPPGAGH